MQCQVTWWGFIEEVQNDHIDSGKIFYNNKKSNQALIIHLKPCSSYFGAGPNYFGNYPLIYNLASRVVIIICYCHGGGVANGERANCSKNAVGNCLNCSAQTYFQLECPIPPPPSWHNFSELNWNCIDSFRQCVLSYKFKIELKVMFNDQVQVKVKVKV